MIYVLYKLVHNSIKAKPSTFNFFIVTFKFQANYRQLLLIKKGGLSTHVALCRHVGKGKEKNKIASLALL